MGKGSQWERKLKNELEDDYGWGAIRTGGSGSATDRELPDIIAGDGGQHYWAIEAKYKGSDKRVYEDLEKVDDLAHFATRFGAKPMYAVRYSTRLDGVTTADWRVAPLDVAREETTDINLKLTHSIVSDWPTLSDVMTRV